MDFTSVGDHSAALIRELEMETSSNNFDPFTTTYDWSYFANMTSSDTDLSTVEYNTADSTNMLPSTTGLSDEIYGAPQDSDMALFGDLDMPVETMGQDSHPGILDAAVLSMPNFTTTNFMEGIGSMFENSEVLGQGELLEPLEDFGPALQNGVAIPASASADQSFPGSGPLEEAQPDLQNRIAVPVSASDYQSFINSEPLQESRPDLQHGIATSASASDGQSFTGPAPQEDVQEGMTALERCRNRPAVSTDLHPGNRKGMIKPCPCRVAYTKALNNHKNRCTPFQPCQADCWFYQHFHGLWSEKKDAVVEKTDPDTSAKVSVNGLWSHLYEDKKPRSAKKKEQRQAGPSSK